VTVLITGTATAKVYCRSCAESYLCPDVQEGTDLTETGNVEIRACCEELSVKVTAYTSGCVHAWLRTDRDG
jgi:hypothetical protein